MDFEVTFLLLFMELIVAHAHELTKRYHDNGSHKFQEAHEFFEKASHEAVTLMVFFQVTL